MIKINLLPTRASKKKETARQQLSIFVLTLALFLVAAAAAYSTQLIKISSAKSEVENSKKEIQRLKTIIGEMDNVKKLQDEVKKKLDVLNRLRKEKTGPAMRLAKLSDATPEKLWLTKYSEAGGSVSIAGVAFNEDLLAAFMRNLQSSDEYANVELQVSEQTELSGVKVKKFELACSLKSFKKEEPIVSPKK